MHREGRHCTRFPGKQALCLIPSFEGLVYSWKGIFKEVERETKSNTDCSLILCKPLTVPEPPFFECQPGLRKAMATVVEVGNHVHFRQLLGELHKSEVCNCPH